MGSIYASFVIFESLTLRKEKRTICLSEFTQASKSLFFLLTRCQRQLVGFRGGIATGNVGALESLTLRKPSRPFLLYLSYQGKSITEG